MKKQLLFALFLFFFLAGKSQDTFVNYTNTNEVISIAIEEDVVWLATTGGVVKRSLDGTLVAVYTTADGLANNSVRSIVIDSQGNKWFGTSGGGVSKFDGTN